MYKRNKKFMKKKAVNRPSATFNDYDMKEDMCNSGSNIKVIPLKVNQKLLVHLLSDI